MFIIINAMKIIILEGIASSGKTAIKNYLCEYLKNKRLNFIIVEEDESLMPILDNKDPHVAINHLKEAISKYLKKNVDVIIFDRLYFTHVFRTKSELDTFSEIENLIKLHNAKIFLLKIDESQIKNRIFGAMKHRGEKWSQYVKSKGNDEEIVDYYTKQQRKLIELLEQTSLEHETLDTTGKDFESISEKVLKKVDL